MEDFEKITQQFAMMHNPAVQKAARFESELQNYLHQIRALSDITREQVEWLRLLIIEASQQQGETTPYSPYGYMHSYCKQLCDTLARGEGGIEQLIEHYKSTFKAAQQSIERGIEDDPGDPA